MKRIYGIFAVLAAIAFVACHHEEIGIDRLVTDAVIDQAVAGLADDMAADFSSTKVEGITYTACMKARHAVFQSLMGKNWFSVLYASMAAAPDFKPDDFWVKDGGNRSTYDQHNYIMDVARRSLDTPEELRVAYFRHKDVALKCVSNNGINQEVRERISYVLPYFNGTALMEKDAMISAYHDASASGWSTSLEAMYKDLVQRGLNISDVRAWEFAERRRAEGGDALVSAYAEIMTDFMTSLPLEYTSILVITR